MRSTRWLALLAAVLFSTGGAVIKAQTFSAVQVSMLRSGIAAVALLVWLRGRLAWTPAAAAVAVVYAATLTCFVAATKLTTAASAILLQSTAPLYVLLLSPIALRERIRGRDLAYLAVMAVGLVLCLSDDSSSSASAPDPVRGNILGAASGVTWALTLVALRRIQRDQSERDAGLTAVVSGNLLACVTALPFALPLPAAGAGVWAGLLYLGLVQIALAYVCLTHALTRVPAFEASLLLLFEPVLNPLWAWLVHGERPGLRVVAAGVVIVGATAVHTLTARRRTGGPARPPDDSGPVALHVEHPPTR